MCRNLLALLVGCGAWTGWARADEKPPAANAGAVADALIPAIEQKVDQQEQPAEDPEEGPFRDNVDARASSDPKLTNELDRADRHIEQQEWHEAIETLQPLLDEFGDTLSRDAEGGWTSLKSAVEARIGRMPDAGLKAYRTQYDGLAAELLNSGGGPGDYQTCMEVSRRYFHTQAGYQAAHALALHHLDSGQFLQAAYWFSRLLDAGKAEPAGAPEWRALAAYALHRAGHVERARELLETVRDTPGCARIEALIQAPVVEPALFGLLDDWPMLYGSADHRGLVEGGEPILLRRWSEPLTARYAIRSQIEDLLLDLVDDSRPPIPAWQPILVDGKVAFRTLRGLAVADVRTGKLLWESALGVSAERLLSGELDSGIVLPSSGAVRIIEYGVGQQDNHQLASLLFRDATHGLLSSDGRLLFSIEHHALMAQSNYGYWWSNTSPSDQDPYHRDWSSNQLTAFDLATGRRVWEVGGRQMDEPFDPPLAGAFLFGPPVPSGDELFVVGEEDKEVHLYVLKASTGELLWRLPLASATPDIEHDWVRRQWAAQPAVDAGLVICPTTVGWLVAVDWRQQRIRWAHRYAPRTETSRGHRGMAFNAQQPLGTRWCQSAPILAGGRVLFSPSEQPNETNEDQPRLVCLDALTGSVQWERAKGAGLYVAGVVGETVVIVERGAVVGVSLADGGNDLWMAAVPAGTMPSGRGVLFADRFLLPLHTGELLTVDVTRGDVVSRQSAPDPGLLPGNLAMHAGTLVSLGPRGIDAFELRESLAAEIARRRDDDPMDPWATVREAEVFQSSGDPVRALELLDGAAPRLRESQPDLIVRHHRRTFDCLLTLCADDLSGRDPEFARLTAVAESDVERFEVQRLDARRRLARGDLPGAFDVYWRLIGSPAPQFVETDSVSCRFDVWLSGQLRDVWSAAGNGVREQFDAHISEAVASALGGDAAEQSRWERLLAFHPQTWRLTWSLVESAIERGDFAPAEIRLRRLMTSNDSAIAASALNRLGELLADFGQPVDAAACFIRLEREFADVVLDDGRTGAEHAATMLDGDLTRESLAPRPVGTWSNLLFEIEHRRAETGLALVQPITLTDDGAEFFRRHRFDFEPNTQQLVISPTGTAIPYWSTPLRMMAQPQAYNQSAAVSGYGLQAVVFHRGVLHALSLPDRRILWTEPVDQVGSAYTRHVVTGSVSPMQPASRFLAGSALIRQTPQHGMLGVARAEYIARYGRRDVRVLDPLTGELLWTCSGVGPQTMLFGDERAVYLTTRGGATHALRAADGSPLEMPGLGGLFESAIAWRPDSMIVVQPGGESGERSGEMTVSAVDRHSADVRWSHGFEDQSRLALIEDKLLIVLGSAGDCHAVDFATSESAHLGTLPEDILAAATQVHVVADPEYLYFLVDHLPNQSVSYVNPPVVRLNGTVFAMRRDGGSVESGIAWQRQVESQNLLLTQFEHSPLLVFLSYQTRLEEALRFTYFHVRLLALDKQTGRVVAELNQPMPNGGGFYQMNLDLSDRTFDIRSHNRLLRIRVVDELSASGE